jgi:5'(3')-deoxyribonucleotidase
VFKIAIDIDDVITDTLGALCHAMTVRGYPAQREDAQHYNWAEPFLKERYGMRSPHHMLSEIWHYPGFLENLEIRPGMDEFLQNLSKIAEITILTARGRARSLEIADRTRFWLFQAKIPYCHLEFTKNKADYCRAHKIPAIIEDSPFQTLECAQNGIYVYLVAHDYNQGPPDNPLIHRVTDPAEILEHLTTQGLFRH